MNEKRWSLENSVVSGSFLFSVFILNIFLFGIILSNPTTATVISINDTTYTLNINSNADTIPKYYYENVTFYALYYINSSIYSFQNCSIYFEDSIISNMTYNSSTSKWKFNRTFSLNGTINYNVSCVINETQNITENSSVFLRYNFAPVLSNITALYNLTDYQTLSVDTGCYDVYNDTINVSITSVNNDPSIIFGKIQNKTNYYFKPEWNHVALNIYNVTIGCTDGYSTVNTIIYLNITPRNVSVNFSYPKEGFGYINYTRDYVYCKSLDQEKVGRFYVIYYNTTYNEILYSDNVSFIITYRNFTQDTLMNISCYTTNIYGEDQGEINRSFIVKIIPPGIDFVVAVPSYTTVTVSWVTNENTTTKVVYGTNSTYFPNQVSNEIFGTNHTITFDNLTKNRDYYFYVESCNAAWLCTKSYINSIHTRDCRYLFSCGAWSACQSGNIKTRTCNCLCSNSCEGNGTTTAYCQFVPTVTNEEKVTYDDKLYYYETEEGFAFSKKYFNTNNLYMNLTKRSSMTEISIILDKKVVESRVVIIDKKMVPGSTLPKSNVINYYNILISGIGNSFSSMSFVFEVDSKYETTAAIAALNGNSWIDVPFTKIKNTTNTTGYVFLKVTSKTLYTDYVTYLNISAPKKDDADINAVVKKEVLNESSTQKILKKYQVPLNILIVIFTIIIGLIIIKIIDNYYSMKRHRLNAQKRDAFIIIDKENPVKKFFKMMFR